MINQNNIVRTSINNENTIAVIIEVSSKLPDTRNKIKFISLVDSLAEHILLEAPSGVEELSQQPWFLNKKNSVEEILLEKQKLFSDEISIISFVRWNIR